MLVKKKKKILTPQNLIVTNIAYIFSHGIKIVLDTYNNISHKC